MGFTVLARCDLMCTEARRCEVDGVSVSLFVVSAQCRTFHVLVAGASLIEPLRGQPSLRLCCVRAYESE